MRKLTDKPPIHGDGPGPEDGMTCTGSLPCESCKFGLYYGRADKSTVTGPFTWLQGHPYCEVCYPRMVAVLEADAKLAGMKSLHEQLSDLETAEQWAASHADKESYLRVQAEAAELRRAQQYDNFGIPRDRQMEERLRRAAQANTVIGRPAPVFRTEEELAAIRRAVREGKIHESTIHTIAPEQVTQHEGVPRAQLPPELIGHPEGASYASVKAMEDDWLVKRIVEPKRPRSVTGVLRTVETVDGKPEIVTREIHGVMPHGIICKVPDGFPFEGKEAAEKSLADGLEAMRKLGEDMARQREELLLATFLDGEAFAKVDADGTIRTIEPERVTQADEPTVVKAKPEGA